MNDREFQKSLGFQRDIAAIRMWAKDGVMGKCSGAVWSVSPNALSASEPAVGFEETAS